MDANSSSGIYRRKIAAKIFFEIYFVAFMTVICPCDRAYFKRVCWRLRRHVHFCKNFFWKRLPAKMHTFQRSFYAERNKWAFSPIFPFFTRAFSSVRNFAVLAMNRTCERRKKPYCSLPTMWRLLLLGSRCRADSYRLVAARTRAYSTVNSARSMSRAFAMPPPRYNRSYCKCDTLCPSPAVSASRKRAPHRLMGHNCLFGMIRVSQTRKNARGSDKTRSASLYRASRAAFCCCWVFH